MDEFPGVGEIMGAGVDQPADVGKLINRDRPEVSLERMDLVKDWCQRIEEAEAHWKEIFDEMRGSDLDHLPELGALQCSTERPEKG